MVQLNTAHVCTALKLGQDGATELNAYVSVNKWGEDCSAGTNVRISRKLEFGKLVTPYHDKERPIHRWFQMKESFSSGLVRMLAEIWGLKGEDFVFDPFAGAGTTPLTCKELGIDCVGYEVHPVLLFASRVKLRDYRPKELRAGVERIIGAGFEEVEGEVPSFIRRVFPKHLLADVLFLKREISKIEVRETREFLLLGLTGALFRGGGLLKDGAVVKRMKKPTPPFRNFLKRVLLEMCADTERFEKKTCEVRVEYHDARSPELERESVDAVITSPPYLGKREYVRAYSVEQWVLDLGEPNPGELLGMRPEGALEEDFSEIGEGGDEALEVKLYFKDMWEFLSRLHEVCKPRAKICVVTSDGCFREGVVEVCVRLSRLAEKIGFKAKRTVVVNERWCTTPSRRKVGRMKEALLLLEKP
jgi:DNA modification methylase